MKLLWSFQGYTPKQYVLVQGNTIYSIGLAHGQSFEKDKCPVRSTAHEQKTGPLIKTVHLLHK